LAATHKKPFADSMDKPQRVVQGFHSLLILS
jgi:hypothetical protein